MSDSAAPSKPARRPRDIARTRADILAAALIEFADKGLAGARVDEIAARTATTKPTIYYHFGNKEGLYTAVLEHAYGGMRDLEGRLEHEALPPDEAMRRLVEATFDYHAENPGWVRLIMAENMSGARHIAAAPGVGQRNAPVVRIVQRLLDEGERQGVFRTGIDPLNLHWMICSMCFYRVSNRDTWKANFGFDMAAPRHAAVQRQMAVDAVLRFLRVDAA